MSYSSAYRTAAVFVLSCSVVTTSLAQSGSSSSPAAPPYTPPAAGAAPRAVSQGSGQSAPIGSAGRVANAVPQALGGYCAVCLAQDRQWMPGRPEFAADFDGKRYLFPGAEQLQKFQANPARFAPALGGDDVVEYARSGRRVVGQLPLGAAYQGRFYFFASDANKQAFLTEPARYAGADLALGGACVVCRVDMNQQVAGDPAINAVYQGVRYLFPAEAQRQAFLANPARYVSAAPQVGAGSATQRSPAAGSGYGGSAPAGSGSGGR